MKWVRICALIIFLGLIIIINVYAAESLRWGYSGPNGPENWCDIAPEYLTCQYPNGC